MYTRVHVYMDGPPGFIFSIYFEKISGLNSIFILSGAVSTIIIFQNVPDGSPRWTAVLLTDYVLRIYRGCIDSAGTPKVQRNNG